MSVRRLSKSLTSQFDCLMVRINLAVKERSRKNGNIAIAILLVVFGEGEMLCSNPQAPHVSRRKPDPARSCTLPANQ